MKSVTKKITVAGLGAACVLSLAFSAGMLAGNSSAAKADTENDLSARTNFFYDYLLDANNKEYTLAKKFYDVFEQMNKDGDFKDGVIDYPISDIVTSQQLKAWVEDGDLEVPRAFSAARDAFLTDHPEIFYINFYKMTISVARSNGAYIGFINSGKEANLYYDNGFNTPEAVADAVVRYEAKIEEIVNKVKASQSADGYSAKDEYFAKEVNKYFAENIEYDYVAYENKEDPDYIAAAYINSSYGGIVEGRAVCGGYSTSYKVIMDRLGVPCITVNGYSNNRDETGNNSGSAIYHMWNYVWLKTPSSKTKSRAASSAGEWYSVDVTWNSSSVNKYRYALLNDYSDKEIHVSDGVISTSGYRLRYPALSSFTYGGTGETDGLQYSRTYTPVAGGALDDYGKPLMDNFSTVSYNGKSAKRLLEEDGLYLVCRFAYYSDAVFEWSKWMSLETFRQFAEIGVDDAGYMIRDNGTETVFYDNTSIYYTQFAVFDSAPDVPNHVVSETNQIDKYFYFQYTDALVEKSNSIEIGDLLVNESYGTYTPPPYVKSTTPMNTVNQIISDNMRNNKGDSLMNPNKALTITVTYDEPLHILDETQKIEVSFVSEHPNTQKYAFFADLDNNGTKVELVDEYTLKFKFCPSLMYEHNGEGYHFFFSNVGSAKIVTRIVDGKEVHEMSNKRPNDVYFTFSRLYMACPAIFNYDGRLWIDCCAQPTLVANSDLSAMDFKDEKGESTFNENQRSQMMLVAERADDATVDTMLDEISNHDGINVDKKDIKKSETYDIALQMCGKVPTIPDGSYVKIALGFPDGYGPKDEGVTFKLFHRKHISGDNYIIEEIPCVVTQFGIVATVRSFSPYMVAVVDENKATAKTVYASIEGNGGKLSVEDGQIWALTENDDETTDWDDRTHTYTIKPDDGYQIYSVTLNGKDVQDKIVDGKLTLSYDDEDLGINNQLVIQYIADEAKARIQQKLDNNLIDESVEVEKHIVAVADQPVYPNDPIITGSMVSGTNNTTNVTAIVITVICVVVVLAGGTAAIVICTRRNKKNS